MPSGKPSGGDVAEGVGLNGNGVTTVVDRARHAKSAIVTHAVHHNGVSDALHPSTTLSKIRLTTRAAPAKPIADSTTTRHGPPTSRATGTATH